MKLSLLGGLLLLSMTLSAKDVILDTSTSLLWQDSAESRDMTMTYFEAKDYCAKLSISEYSDFRVPTLYELRTIVDYKNYKPASLSGINYTASETYWTTTEFADDASEVWTINFKKGEYAVKGKHYTRNIRCVQKLKK